MSEMQNTRNINFEDILIKASQLPYCKIDRNKFLTSQFKGKISEVKLMEAIENGTINAGINIALLNNLAQESIKYETKRVVALSFASGIPGGVAMIGTVPADLVQFYAHIIRIIQKLAYLYGYKDIIFDDGTQNVIIIFLGSMLGANLANAAIVKFAAENAVKMGNKVAAQPLTKIALYNIAKKVLAWVGVKITKDTVGKAVTKAVPILGGFIAGGISYSTYTPMATKLQKYLSKVCSMTPEELEKETIKADLLIRRYIK